jgi:RNA polymerase sigma factor (sigma-70 family)
MVDKFEPVVDEAKALDVYKAAFVRARSHSARLSKEEAEDVAQEVVARYVERVKFVLDAPAWANQVAGNLCIDRIRERIRLVDGEAVEVETVERFITEGRRTSQDAGLAIQAYWAVAQMTPKERRLIDLVANDVSQAEIATTLDYASADSVKTTLTRLRKRLREAARAQDQPTDWESFPRVY